jgi:hypothetical protein
VLSSLRSKKEAVPPVYLGPVGCQADGQRMQPKRDRMYFAQGSTFFFSGPIFIDDTRIRRCIVRG